MAMAGHTALRLRGLRPGKALTLATAALALLAWTEFTLRIVLPVMLEGPWRRPAAWVAARLALEGQADLIYRDRAVFAAESVRLGALPDIFEPNAPTTLLFYLPLAPLPIDLARNIWIIFNLVCLLAALWTLLRVLRLPLPVMLATIAAVAAFQPVRNNTHLGQVYGLALLLVVAGSVLAGRASQSSTLPTGAGASRYNSVAAGCAFALLAIVRQFYGLMQLLTPLIKRQWTVLISTACLYTVVAVVTLGWLGPGIWVESLRSGLTWRGRPESAVTAYQSVNGLLTHLFRYHPTWNPGPVADLPWLLDPLWWALTLLIVAASSVAVWRSQASRGEDAGEGNSKSTPASGLLPYALATPVALLVSPTSEEYHFAQALFPLVVVGTVLWERQVHRAGRSVRPRTTLASWLVLALALLLLGLPLRYYNVPGTEGVWAFAYYPRLYGTLLLWGLMLALLWRLPRLPDKA
jgi:hypothetical protein